jgi:NAD(P)-dependent dehydrogenase (short-subunit alcohol dehydrogenase family)
MFDFKDQVVTITGASGSLGASAASGFAAAGAKLALLDIRPEPLEALTQELPSASSHLSLAPVDMTDEASVKEAFARIVEQFGRIDVLLNIAGGYRAGTPAHETKLADWDFMLALNARSAFLASREAAGQMLRQGRGRIISIGARPGLKGAANAAAYSVSKSVVIRLTESMAEELKSGGINVNCILPGTMDTPGNRKAMPDARHELWVPTDAVVDVMMFLASDASRAIHGAAIPAFGLT